MFHRALNQKTAGDLPFEAFLDLAAALGCAGVEPRNDLGRPLFDGIAPAVVTEMARTRGLRILGLSEVYGFNVWNKQRVAQIQTLIDMAEATGAETISLIPSVDDRPTRPLRYVMQEIAALFDGRAILPLIEPIGFASSTLRHKAELVEAIDAVGGPQRFKLVHDTFQHTIAGETEVFPEYTALVHISGISNPDVTLDAAQDSRRLLVDAADRCDNAGQASALLAGGYQGAFSFECTEPGLIALPDAAAIHASFTLLETAVARHAAANP